MNVRIQGGQVYVTSPYNERFVNAAPQLGGKWDRDAREWVFDARDEERVRNALAEAYGHDGRDHSGSPKTDVRLDMAPFKGKRKVFGFGEVIAERGFRDSLPKLMSGAVVIEGRFPPSGGSRKYPALASGGVILEIRDVPSAVVPLTRECLIRQLPKNAELDMKEVMP